GRAVVARGAGRAPSGRGGRIAVMNVGPMMNVGPVKPFIGLTLAAAAVAGAPLAGTAPPQYDIRPAPGQPGTFLAANPAQGLEATVAAHGVLLTPLPGDSAWHVELGPARWDGVAISDADAASCRLTDNRIDCLHEGRIAETWISEPSGLTQQLRLAEAAIHPETAELAETAEVER